MDQNIILLFGGESDERLVSVASAQALAQALGEPTLWFWSPAGFIYPVDFTELINHKEVFTKEFIPKTQPIFSSISDAIQSPESLNKIFVLGVHGGTGEDGTLQALCEKYKRAYTGSDAQSSQRAFNKLATKSWLKDFNILMAPHIILEPGKYLNQLTEFLKEHQEIIIKPVSGGSSLGCSFVKNLDNLPALVQAISQDTKNKYFAEKIISGRELTIGVIENANAVTALPVTEIIKHDNHNFDYEGKYLARGTSEITPADISEILTREAQRLAVAAHVALKLEGYSRTDMIASPEGLYYLETNTLPGLAKESLVPQQLAVAHMTLREFLAIQIRIAKERLQK